MTPGWLVYDFPADYKGRKPERYRGQRQKWALMLFEGDDSEVDLMAHDPQEFCDWQWAEMDGVPEVVVPFKRGVYRALVESFRPMANYVTGRT
jgi:putative (di)nucleoside polyphosphate hydrolase